MIDRHSLSTDLLKVLDLKPSLESVDYVTNKDQFHLHILLTEQRHAKTWNLSSDAKTDLVKALRSVFEVDKDISAKFQRNDFPWINLDITNLLDTKKKIYIYGCGATGRLAKQMESSFWRPFWNNPHLRNLPNLEEIQNLVIGEMTGGDRALISSLEGLEDLQLIGKLQLQDHNIGKGKKPSVPN